MNVVRLVALLVLSLVAARWTFERCRVLAPDLHELEVEIQSCPAGM